MRQEDFFIIEPMIEKIVENISNENKITPIQALEMFYASKTYELLIHPGAYVWDLSDKALFGIWKKGSAGNRFWHYGKKTT